MLQKIKLFLGICLVGIFFLHNGLSQMHYNVKTRTLFDNSTSDSVQMIVMGDWGGLPIPPYYSPFEKATAIAMMKYSQVHQTEFLLALGDNFYYNGVVDEFDARFKTTFEDVFNDPNFGHIPWYVLAGNHDHYGNITGELAYTKHSSRWVYPDLWYAIKVVRPFVNMTIVMIDTVSLCGNTLADDETSAPDGNINPDVESAQLDFIEQQLKHSKDQYVMVAGHFPVWSVAEHGPTQCLIEKLKPLLEKYNVNAYLCGHDHNLQHIREKSAGVNYFVSGAVDVVDPNMTHEASIPNDSLQFHWANILGLGGFAAIKATNQSMEFTFNSAVGNVLYRYQMKPRK